jgi:hypothetical protein
MTPKHEVNKLDVSWRMLSPYPLSDQDIKEINVNLTSFFSLLFQWDKATDKQCENNGGEKNE